MSHESPGNQERTERDLAIVDSLQRQAETDGKLKWHLSLVEDYYGTGAKYRYAVTSIGTEAAGEIEVSIGGQYILGPQQRSETFDRTLYLALSTTNGQQRLVAGSPTGDPNLFDKLNDLLRIAMRSVENERNELDETKPMELGEKKDAFEAGLDEIIDAGGLAL